MRGGNISVTEETTHVACREPLLESGVAMVFLDAVRVFESVMGSPRSGPRMSNSSGCSAQAYAESRLSPEKSVYQFAFGKFYKCFLRRGVFRLSPRICHFGKFHKCFGKDDEIS